MDATDFSGARRNLIATCFGVQVYILGGGAIGVPGAGTTVSILGGTVLLDHPVVLKGAALAMLFWFALRYQQYARPRLQHFKNKVQEEIPRAPEFSAFAKDQARLVFGAFAEQIRLSAADAPNAFHVWKPMPNELYVRASAQLFGYSPDSEIPQELDNLLKSTGRRLMLDRKGFARVLRRIRLRLQLQSEEWSSVEFPYVFLGFTVGLLIGHTAYLMLLA